MKKYLSVIPLVFLLCFAAGCQKAVEVAEEELTGLPPLKNKKKNEI